MRCDPRAIRSRFTCDPYRHVRAARFPIRTPCVGRRVVVDAWSARIAKCAAPQQPNAHLNAFLSRSR
eukprot:7624158-Lingulodinium_polyedra.AAC.1